MATPATLNNWLDQLSSSILSTQTTSTTNQKKFQDAFRRRVKRHNYARTNQFEVAERLTGLEEKFQILSLANLSDALRQRRNELKEFQNNWLPDVLDLFLHLSGDPARNERLLELYRVPPRIGTPPPLRWKDVLADDPIDRHDRLWKVPDFSDADDSGYEDDDHTFGTPSSTVSANRHAGKQDHDFLFDQSSLLYELDDKAASAQADNIRHGPNMDQISEGTFIRQILLFLHGYPVNLFSAKHNHYQLRPSANIRGIPPRSLDLLVEQISSARRDFDTVSRWIGNETDCAYVAAMKNAAGGVLKDYSRQLDTMQQEFISPTKTSATSVLRLACAVGDLSTTVSAVARFLDEVGNDDSITCLEKLYDAVQSSQVDGQLQTYQCLCSLLVPALHAYLGPVWEWLECGQIDADNEAFFINIQSSKQHPRKLWHGRYVLQMTGQHRPPAFLANTAGNILACGKTSAFLKQILSGTNSGVPFTDVHKRHALLEEVHADTAIPFAASFENVWHGTVTDLLQRQTEQLKVLLSAHCGFEETLDALGYIYLRQDSVLLDEIEMKLFDRIDRCITGWNDRFQLRDMLEEAFHTQGLPHVPDAITIHSAYTSSRSMHNRRISVKILNALAFEYVLSWPLANIIDEDSMTAYRRVSLVLTQIRRAKYCIERTGYLSAMSTPLADDATLGDQKFAQILAFTLLTFVNTLYDHLMTTTISPLTLAMRQDIHNATTVDEMIKVHKGYMTSLEYSCLAVPKLKVLRQSLITLLDLCIRFSDLVSNPAKAQHVDSDHEASSFMSALSRRKTLRVDQYGSDSEDDDAGQLGDGYSSFIVLEDDTSIVKELRKVQAQLRRHLKFFIAGLRGVGRAGGHVQHLEQLADRLDWNQIR